MRKKRVGYLGIATTVSFGGFRTFCEKAVEILERFRNLLERSPRFRFEKSVEEFTNSRIQEFVVRLHPLTFHLTFVSQHVVLT